MSARTLILIAALMVTFSSSSDVAAKEWARKMFDQIEYDFGDLARGAKAEHRFKITNLYQEDLRVQSVKSSCGCTLLRMSETVIPSGQDAELIAEFNTVAFEGEHTATLTVVFAPPFAAEVRLQVRGFVRRDVVFQPGRIEFGSVPRSQAVEKQVRVAYAGRLDWKIVDVRSENKHVEVELHEQQRGGGRVTYEMTFRLKDTAPAGYINDHLTLITNDADHRLIPLAVEGYVMPALTVSPTSLYLGKLRPGQSVTKQIVVRSSTPFRIVGLDCEGGGDCFEFATKDDARKVHLVPVTFKAPSKPGSMVERIRIKTTGTDETAPTITAQAEIVDN